MTLTEALDEMVEMIGGLQRRATLLGGPGIRLVIADNCCTISKGVKAKVPQAEVVLDIYHFKQR